MGITVCKTHGRCEFVETCAHVARAIDAGQMPSGHRFDVMGHLFVCDDCFEKLGFLKVTSLANLSVKEFVQLVDGRAEAYELAYGAIEGRRTFCLKCFADLEG